MEPFFYIDPCGTPAAKLNGVAYFLDFASNSGDPRWVPPISVWRLDSDPDTTALPHVSRVLFDRWNDVADLMFAIPN
jgi:hypothetical protein